jgi:hypothetical protein
MAAGVELGRKIGAADELEIALGVVRAIDDVHRVRGRDPVGRLRAGDRCAERHQRDTQTGDPSEGADERHFDLGVASRIEW